MDRPLISSAAEVMASLEDAPPIVADSYLYRALILPQLETSTGTTRS